MLHLSGNTKHVYLVDCYINSVICNSKSFERYTSSNYFIIRWTLIVLFHFENRQLSLPNSVLYFAWSVRIDFLFVIRVSFFLALVSILPFCCSKFNFCLQCGCQFYSLRKSHYFFSRFNFCVVTSLSFLRYVM